MPITTGVKCLGIILLIHGHFYRRKILQYIDNVTNILCHCLNTPSTVSGALREHFSGSVLIYANVNIVNGGHGNYPRTSKSNDSKQRDLVIRKDVDLITKSRKKPEWKCRTI